MAGAQKLPLCVFVILCAGFLLMGTMSSVTGKIMYQTNAPPDPTSQPKPFLKPWFQVWVMFLAMMLCGPLLVIQRIVERLRGRGDKLKPIVSGQSISHTSLIIAVPASCDLLATGLQNIALLFTNVSIWQMLRGSTPVFTALIRYFYLGKRTRVYEMWGVGFVMLGLAIVGGASFVTPSAAGTADVGAGAFMKTLGIVLVLLAQFIQAFQMVVEEQLLHDVESNALFIVAMEGFWGLLLSSVFVMPLAQFLPGEDGLGVHEDIWPQEWYSLQHSQALQIITVAFVLVITFYNVYGMWITELTEATTRNVMDAGRTLCVWLFTLSMNFIAPQYGEQIGYFSLIELCGFVVLMLGIFVYYKTIQLPWIRKGGPDDLKTPFMSPQPSLTDPSAFSSPGPHPFASPAGALAAYGLKNQMICPKELEEAEDGNIVMEFGGDQVK